LAQPGFGGTVEGEKHVAAGAEAVVELDHGLPQAPVPGPKFRKCLRNVALAAQVLEAIRDGDSGLAEDPAGTTLAAQMGQFGIGRIKRDPESYGKLTFETGTVECHQAGAERITDCLPDFIDQMRSAQNLFCEWSRLAIGAVEHGQPAPRMPVRHRGNQVKGVVHNDRGQAVAADIDHLAVGRRSTCNRTSNRSS
jgi:hypothetical protein